MHMCDALSLAAQAENVPYVFRKSLRRPACDQKCVATQANTVYYMAILFQSLGQLLTTSSLWDACPIGAA